MEIEKKFRIKRFPKDLEQYPCIEIEQGYLCRGPVVRIRKANEDYILTYKSKTGQNEDALGLKIANEVELPLTESAYLHLREKIDGKLITKTRYKIPLENGRKAELDIFHGYLEGLQFVEVEFDSTEQAVNFQPPEWFGEDVSTDHRFANNYLCTISEWKEIE